MTEVKLSKGAILVKKLREEKNLSIRQLHLLTEIPETTLKSIESGKAKTISRNTVDMLSRFFNVPVSEFRE